MSPDDQQQHRHRRFARIRRVKRFLRLVPRRARLHKYPVIGRFAALARRRSHLWSFKTRHVRPSIYAGAILTMLPLMGIQIPLSFILALLLRSNFMVMAALQLITNPFTAVPAYYGTYQLGKIVIEHSGFGRSIVVEDLDFSLIDPDQPPPPTAPASEDEAPARLRWTQGLGTSINALLIGGTIAGLGIAIVLDGLWRFGVRHSRRHSPRDPPLSTGSGSTDTPAASK